VRVDRLSRHTFAPFAPSPATCRAVLTILTIAALRCAGSFNIFAALRSVGLSSSTWTVAPTRVRGAARGSR